MSKATFQYAPIFLKRSAHQMERMLYAKCSSSLAIARHSLTDRVKDADFESRTSRLGVETDLNSHLWSWAVDYRYCFRF
jgi:hypothetical protein